MQIRSVTVCCGPRHMTPKHQDLPALRKLDGIADEVDENLFHPLEVTHEHARQRRIDMKV